MKALNKELGELLCFLSSISISVRMNTAYNGSEKNGSDTATAAMWLSDALHKVAGLGSALQTENPGPLFEELHSLKAYWLRHKDELEHALAVNPHEPTWSVEQGVQILNRIEQVLSE